ncbi:hypothetical protein [Streptomyces sp. C]|uniref:hypothetical protein n=1 Tax=Streptomyces sp. C TaxID=253839 RepID=UPI0001B5833C|nr:hypothetical protein [Streptomyces sp. C]EFL19438.1 predicted protein [Streptomyces sp. C]
MRPFGGWRKASRKAKETTAKSYKVLWTKDDGTPMESVVSYDEPSAEERRAELEASGAADVRVVPFQL